jgi:hypothetical protein
MTTKRKVTIYLSNGQNVVIPEPILTLEELKEKIERAKKKKLFLIVGFGKLRDLINPDHVTMIADEEIL